ncbi:aminotransferase class III-fold pyridoxal phosphate-dependent enzyme, partial [Actinokineospora pegani]|uniref:aminotransferase class III-fold pyridoxal phosphate-dependent enzyme n=1 Tax=Actinokineospora pegani TaxID=2654637 RepID=UPI0012EA78BB
AAVEAGAGVGRGVWAALDVDPDAPDAFATAMARLAERNAAALGAGPVFLTLAGGFHGKLGASVQLTHNPGYRLPFQGLGAPARFLAADAPEAVAEAVAAERRAVLVPVVEAGVVTLRERDAPVICAFFVEPVQGEGGIHVLTPRMAGAIRAAADLHGFPVVVDEVQSGMGRTGRFFSAAATGLLGDVFVLAKGIGGGIAKSAVVLIRRSRYRSDFELVHSSTFAKDAFSCHIGIEVVGMLEADGGAAYAAATERGAALRAEAESVRADYPDVLVDVRGAGLMLGVEFADLSSSPDPVLSENAVTGLIGYVLSGYLLREHRVRVFPTASAAHTLRLEPSLGISDDAIRQFGAALRGLCALLRKGDGLALLPS